MNWFEFTKSKAKVYIRHTASGKPLLVIASNTYLGEKTDFGQKMLSCNHGNRLLKGEDWQNFKYSEKSNAWFRPLLDLRLSDLFDYFKDEINLISSPNISNNVYEEINNEERSLASSTNSADKRGLDSPSSTGIDTARRTERAAIGGASKGEQTTFLFAGDGATIRRDGIEGIDENAKSNTDRIMQNESGNLGSTDSSAGYHSDENRIESSKFLERNLQGRNNYFPKDRGIDFDKRGNKERFSDNVSAIRILRERNDQNEIDLSDEDIAAIIKFSGWGGLGNEVIENESDNSLNKILSTQERKGLYNSALYGYFTPNSLISSIWDLLENKGFKGGLILEPACATGRFIEQRLTKFDNQQHFTGIEIDRLSSDVCKALHPKAKIINTGFEKCYASQIKDVGYDLVVGNFPFGEMRLIDENGISRSIHNHFLVKSIEALRSGGIISVITSTHTLDSQNIELRKSIHNSAQLLAAIRLPNNVFEGTSIQCDLLFFRKRGTEMDNKFKDIDFVNLAEESFRAIRDFKLFGDDGATKDVEEGDYLPLKVNECFTNNENCFLAGAPYVGLIGRGTKLGLILKGDINSINEKVALLKSEITWFDSKNSFLEKGLPTNNSNGFTKTVYKKPTIGGLIEVDGSIKIVESFQQKSTFEYTVETANFKIPNSPRGIKINVPMMLLDYISIRDCVVDILECDQLSRIEESTRLRENLNIIYDSFVKDYGFINSRTIRKFIRNDALVGLALGLEHYNEEDETKTKKSDIFFKSTVKEIKIPKSAETLLDAVSLSISQYGKIEPQYIENLTSRTLDDLIIKEPNIIFYNPENSKYEHRNTYLTGNVVRKLKLVESILEIKPELQANYDALKGAVPPRLRAADIGVSMGSRWLPNSILESYIKNVFSLEGIDVIVNLVDGDDSSTRDVKINHSKGSLAKFTSILETTYGAKGANFERVLRSLMSSSPIVITVKVGERNVVDKEATASANNKREFVKEDFERWILSKQEISESIEEIYNNEINVYSYEVDFSDVNYLFPNMSADWNPRAHQKDFVLNALLSGNMLNADCVGAGKTGMQVMLAHELSRLGKSRFPVIVVPNHMLYQTAGEAQQIYPASKICIVTKDDMDKENRSAFVAKMTMNSWDFGIITYSMFTQIMPPVEYLEKQMEDKLSDYRQALLQLKQDKDSRMSTRDIIKKVKKLEEKLEILKESSMANTLPIQLDQVGIDSVLYDEFHKLKNLELDIVKAIPGISSSSSQISFVEHQKMKFIMDEYYSGEEQGIYAFTATPISNSISELYSLTRMLKPSIWREQRIHNFNDWAAQYGNIVTALEVLPEGGGFQVKSRLSSFQNLPELLSSFRSFTQSNTREQLKLPVPKYEEVTMVQEPGKWSKYIFNWLIQRATELRGNSSNGDNFLAIVGDAAMAAISPKAFKSNMPEEFSKVNLCANNVAQIYKNTTNINGVQLVFCDRSTPSAKGPYNAYQQVKNILIELGIPDSEIAFIHDSKTDEQRDTLLKKVNSGVVRVLLGSTEKLGTGTNVQKHLVALHDLDIPWTPKELEQRLGRGVRQGNTNSFLKIFRYLTKGSFDVFRLETIKRKALAIASAMCDPRKSERRFEEDTSIDYDTMIAETTNNPIVREKAKVDALYVKLKRQEQDFYEATRERIDRLDNAVKNRERTVPRLSERLNGLRRISDFTKYSPKIEIEIGLSENKINEIKTKQRMVQAQFTTNKIDGYCDGETTWLDYKYVAKILPAILVSTKRDLKVKVYGENCCVEYNGFNQFHFSLLNENFTSSYFHYDAHLEPHNIFGRLLQAPIVELPDNIKVLRTNLKSYEDQIAAYDGVDRNAKFGKAQELAEVVSKRTEIELQITELSKSSIKEAGAVPDIGVMLELYHLASDKAGFDPNDPLTWDNIAELNTEHLESTLFENNPI